MKKVIVTGSSGFIGKALVKELLNSGIEVIEVDRLNPISTDWEHPNEARCIGYPLANGDIDCIFHLAAQTSVFNPDIPQVMEDNIDAFVKVCDMAKEAGVKLVYASSSCAADGNATSIYGISKRFDEEYARCYNPTATGIRFHNVYGADPRQGTLLWYLLNFDKVTLYNMGHNRRHFTYIKDIVDSLLYAADSKEPLLNAFNPQISSTREFAENVSLFKPIVLEMVSTTRERDKAEQYIDFNIPIVPLLYTPIEVGIRKVFEDG